MSDPVTPAPADPVVAPDVLIAPEPVAPAPPPVEPPPVIEPTEPPTPAEPTAEDIAAADAANQAAEKEHIKAIAKEDAADPRFDAMMKHWIRKNTIWLERELQMTRGGMIETDRETHNP